MRSRRTAEGRGCLYKVLNQPVSILYLVFYKPIKLKFSRSFKCTFGTFHLLNLYVSRPPICPEFEVGVFGVLGRRCMWVCVV